MSPSPLPVAASAVSRVSAAARALLSPSPGLPWARPALLLVGGTLALDGFSHLIQPGPSLLLGLGALAGGAWLLAPRSRPALARRPESLEGWQERCEALLPQFTALEGPAPSEAGRRRRLAELAAERLRPEPLLALVGVGADQASAALEAADLAATLRGPQALRLQVGHPLASSPSDWSWPEGPAAADALLFRLTPPLGAAELRWLEAVPEGQPVWLLLTLADGALASARREEILRQWPAADPQRLLFWNGQADGLGEALAPLATWLGREGAVLRQRTGRRRLEQLHGQWQAELERLRRQEWQRLQQRTQWVVAAGVLVTPLASLDLLVVVTAQGLMLREMARLWDCPWTLEQLKAAASELARAALAQGVVEWSSQALAAAVKLHGATWLLGGALQALSAAYLTRVVGSAMADLLALTAGVSEPDLVRIRLEAPLLVARAAEREKLDWGAFLEQGRQWLRQAPAT
jgi:hypothetical protein